VAVYACGRYKSLVQSFRLIWKEEGWAGMYGGLSVHLLRTVPNAAIMFMIVEALTDTGV
jgi:solute carrier family 25 protein 33/36